jgi:hypothetical protein
MMIDKKSLIYVGVGALVVLVVYNSTRKIELKEVTDASISNKKSFDHSSLPSTLTPPYKLAEGEPLPPPVRKGVTLNSIGLKARFDSR